MGKVSQKWHSLGHTVASFDYDYSKENMDFLSVSGFLLILYAILNMAPRALSLWAPDCGSWGIPCRGTSMRSYINPDGYVAYGFVARANMMISRLTLCLLVVVSQSCFYLLEQPAPSLLVRHKRFEWFCNRVAWVFFTRFWMLHHGGSSSKRSVFWGNLSAMNALDKGKMTHAERMAKTTVKTTRSYFDKAGRRRFVGQKKELKSTQAYPEGLGQSLHDIYMEELKRPPRGDLRVNLTPDHEKSPVQLFTQLPLGDCWRDADLLPVFEYVYKCRHTRIPDEWQSVMSNFHKELETRQHKGPSFQKNEC
ncbi:unnamed protein product [Cladocopium goreaui]|uniref:Uncharacterized protein n=1 Tax=Cladocopium goreaui TaxID=2562237 RepID=A0A9P1G1W5_9DINO|nr:unnamed protein product [Cladocopium goreaui]